MGITGNLAAPELYVAVGISGTTHHMSSCSGSKTIVVTNQGLKANIFKHSHFAVIGDWMKVLAKFETKIIEMIAE